MKPTHYFITLVFCLIAFTAQAQIMSVLNPDWPWGSESGAAIENVEIEVRPVGIFAEVAIAFDVECTVPELYDPEDQLEFVYNFNLEKQAVFNSSWLWIEEYISVGEIYDRFTGTEIYEGIVNRNEDPSILTKFSEETYELRIFPMHSDSTRRVRLSYLIPSIGSGGKSSIELPIQFIQDSWKTPSQVSLTVFDDDHFAQSPIIDFGWNLVQSGIDYLHYHLIDINQAESEVHYHQREPYTPLISTTQSDENFFQLVFDPNFEIPRQPINHVILIDHEAVNTNLSLESVFSHLQNAMGEMHETDKFLLVYSDFFTKFTSGELLQYNTATLLQSFEVIADDDVDTYSNLTKTFPETLSKIEELGEDVVLTILSSGSEFTSFGKTNDFYSEVVEIIAELPMHVEINCLDYAVDKPYAFSSAGVHYYGNDYLYKLLSELTLGEHEEINHLSDLEPTITEVIASSELFVAEFDIHLDIDDGFAYDLYFLNADNNEIAIDQPIGVVGKYYGEGGISLTVDALVNGDFYSYSRELEESDFVDASADAQNLWTTQYILHNEFNSNPDIIRDVVEKSEEESLLSYQTVFLCLEPDSTAQTLEEDDSPLTSIDDLEEQQLQLDVYPNPFTNKLIVTIKSDETYGRGDLFLRVTNALGQLVYESIEFTRDNSDYSFEWSPDLSLEEGLYYIQIISPSNQMTQQVLLAR